MKRILFIVFLISFLMPTGFVSASGSVCLKQGYTVLTLNGVFTNEREAQLNKEALAQIIDRDLNGEIINLDFLHNPSHLAGVGDVLKAAYQKYFDTEIVEDYDLREMLLSASQKVTTQKLLVVAHSQGNFYANSFYDTVAGKTGGVPTESIGVYAVATPSSRVAGGGKWLTSDTDKVIAGAVGRVPLKGIMSPNTHIDLGEGDDSLGHNFSDVYLKYRGAKIVEDIGATLGSLSSNDIQDVAKPCLVPPELGVVHKIEKVAFFVADPAAETTVKIASNTYNTTTFFVRTTVSGIASAVSAFSNLFSKTNQNVAAVVSSGQIEDADPSSQVVTEISGSEPVINIENTIENEASAQPAAENVVPVQVDEAPIPVPIVPLVVPVAKPDFVIVPGFGGGGGGSSNQTSDESTPAPAAPAAEPVVFSIAEPLDLNQTFNTTEIVFRGTSTADASIKTDTNLTATANASGAWELSINFAEGTTALQVWADVDGRESEKESLNISVDSVGPNLAFEIEECDDSLTADSCLLAAESEVNLSWSSSEATDFEINLNGVISETSATSTTASISADGTYNFSVTAEDTASNETTKQINVEKVASPVVINEIAWAGTTASPSDEWIELYNRTDKSIGLSGFTLEALDGTPSIPLTGEIAASSYFLLERASDDAVSDVSADLVYGNGGSSFAMNNNGEQLFLKVGDYNIDQTPALLGGWCCGQISGRRSMERQDADTAGSSISNWGTAPNEFFINGHDRNSGQISGTPRAANGSPRFVSVNGVLSAEKTLTPRNSPYLIGRTGLAINTGVTLNIEAGVVIKFVIPSEPVLTVNGRVVSRGTSENPVVFTSYLDDEYGGDTDGEPCDESSGTNCPTVGSWKYITVRSGGEIDFENTIMRYGGKWFSGSQSDLRTMLRTENAVVRLVDSVIEFSRRYGLFLLDSQVEIRNSTFRNMNTDTESSALVIVDSNVVLDTPTFENNILDISAGGDFELECINCGSPTTDPADLLAI